MKRQNVLDLVPNNICRVYVGKSEFELLSRGHQTYRFVNSKMYYYFFFDSGVIFLYVIKKKGFWNRK